LQQPADESESAKTASGRPRPIENGASVGGGVWVGDAALTFISCDEPLNALTAEEQT